MASFRELIPYAAGTVAGVLTLVVLRRRTARRSLPLPPGPKPLPVIGNLLDLPKEKAWLNYGAWNDQYGDIICLDVLGQKLVVLGSATAVNDLMEQRGTVYSDRASTSMMELTGAQWGLALLPYGDMWRRKRKLMHSHIHQGVADRYHLIQIASARRFARDVLVAGPGEETLVHLVRFNFGQTIIKMVYGIEVESPESEYISLPEEVNQITVRVLTVGQFFVDIFPVLKYIPAWFPGAGFQRLAYDFKNMQRRMLDTPINTVKAQMAEGTAPPSMARAMLEEDPAQVEVIKDVTGQAYLAGIDTVYATIMSFFLAMLVYPDVQSRAQAEVDRVVGTNRLPELSDRKELPYVEGVVNECLRWLPVAPLGVPHVTTRDDEYKGYFIPKGTIILGSVMRILHNAVEYPEPERFNPARYLSPDGKLDPSVRDPRTACFGFGRRICPGRYIADASLYMTVVTLLATVDIVRAKDEQGNEIVPKVDVTGGGLSYPKPFLWATRPRSRHAQELLTSDLA